MALELLHRMTKVPLTRSYRG